MRRLHQRVAARIRDHQLWRPGDRVAVAVSGGRDSMCLLDLLVASVGLHGGRLEVVTVDHGTRPDSAEDASFVAAAAAALGLGCTVARHGLGAGASEEACRDARLAVFAALEVDVVALGHHQRDQVETALLGWLRGGGTAAQGGMAWRQGRWVRPLLDTPPAALDDWAAARGVRWREDPTNATPRFARNRVRHEVLPLLEAVRPGAEAAMARGARHAAADDALLERLSQEEEVPHRRPGGWSRAWVAGGEAPLVRRALRRRLGEVTSGLVDAIVAAARAGSGAVVVSPRVVVVVSGEQVLMDGSAGGGPPPPLGCHAAAGPGREAGDG